MTWLRLAFANLSLSPLTTAVNVLLMALGTASIVLLVLAGVQTAQTMSRNAEGIDLVVGAPGSPVQLVLSAVYHADVPTGNIDFAEVQRYAEDRRVDSAIPVSLGDSYRGFRIVGTEQSYLDLYQAEVAQGRVWDASMEAVVGAAAAEATGLAVGSTFAGAHGLGEGGHEHDTSRYRVVGVLAPTGSVLDRLVVTSLESVWDLHDEDTHHEEHADEHDHDEAHGQEHDHEDEVHDHEDAAHEHDDADHGHEDDEHDHADDENEHANDHEHAEEHAEDEHAHSTDHADDEHGAAHHADDDGREEEHDEHEHHGDTGESAHDGHMHDGEDEGSSAAVDQQVTALLLTYRMPLAAMTLPREINADGSFLAAAPALEITRVLQLVGLGISALSAFAWVLVAVAALSIFAALYGSLRSRRGELAMLRCLGATRGELWLYLVAEGLIMSALGVTLGFVVGHVMMEMIGAWLASSRGVALTGWIWLPAETLLLVGLFVVGLLSAVIPAIQAYRTDVARTLAEA
ncbi:MAG: ABC transporter permease [Pseudomonadota bacterium]